ncbi:protein of unknown function [Burkholderia multivorans]
MRALDLSRLVREAPPATFAIKFQQETM